MMFQWVNEKARPFTNKVNKGWGGHKKSLELLGRGHLGKSLLVSCAREALGGGEYKGITVSIYTYVHVCMYACVVQLFSRVMAVGKKLFLCLVVLVRRDL